MKKMIATITAITVISITGASAWQFDINVGGVDGSDGSVEIDTPDGGGSISWGSDDD